jgi:sugar lactone lactonase YvrE
MIYAFEIDADGILRSKRRFVAIDSEDGYPDGISVDAEGAVWVALWGGWGLLRYSPAGDLLQRISLPCANVTKAAFGGADGRTLFITTAHKGMTAGQRRDQPFAGGLFAVRVDTPGMPQHEVAAIPRQLRVHRTEGGPTP